MGRYSLVGACSIPAVPSSRRRVLAGGAGALAALAGCSALTSDSRTFEYALTLERVESPIGDHVLWTPPLSDDTPMAAERRTALRAATDGERYMTYGYEPLPDGEYAERNGTYYRVGSVVTGRERIARSVLRLEWVGRIDELERVPEHTPVDDLPPLDGNAAIIAFLAARARHTGGGAPWESIERGGYVYRRPGESVLAPDPDYEYLTTHGVVLRVRVSREVIPEPEYTAVATPVASSRAGFRDVIDAAVVDVHLSRGDLTDAARDVLGRAGLDPYRETTPLSSGFEELLIALDLREFLDARERRATNGRYLALGDRYYRYGLYVNEE